MRGQYNMSDNHLRIKYRCQHPDCQIKSCRTGEIEVDETEFAEMSSASGDKTLFKSPRGICRLGFAQTFKALEVMKVSEIPADADLETDTEDINPISILREEHQGGLRRLDILVEVGRGKDRSPLWISLAEVEN